MIDINELRRLAQSATPGHWQFWRGWVAADIDNDGGVIIVERPSPSGGKHQARVDNNFKFIAAANPAAISELLDRFEEAETEALEEARLNGMRAERELALLAKLEAAEKERATDEECIADLMADLNRVGHENDALRAKIERMERQEPVAWMLNCPTLGGDTGWILSWTQSGAGLCNRLQGEENEKRLYALPGAQPAPSVPEGWIQRGMAELEAIRSRQDDDTLLDDRTLIERIGKAMLAAAPEAKP